MKRAIVIVLDGCGAGHAPDAEDYGDRHEPNTLLHVWDQAGPVHALTLELAGFFTCAGVHVVPAPNARYGRLRPLSCGKDSVTGHWEMMGVVLDEPFPTYPSGFPIPLLKEFERQIGTQTLANRPASGTAIIGELGELHQQTGFPIVYTSADSVFQIAAHEEVVPLSTLYDWCRIARELCVEPDNVQRVIARPFVGSPGDYKRTENRKDFPVKPPHNLIDEIGDVFGIGVVPELFDGRGFRPVSRTQSNPEHYQLLLTAMESDARFIFANFEDTDMLFGHRNDPVGFRHCLEQFDGFLAEIESRMTPNDVLIVTADHGNDPCDVSTDHTREYCPIIIIGGTEVGNMGDVDGLAEVGRLVRAHLGV